LKNIRIEPVQHSDQRYCTLGDWYYESDGTLVIRVSNVVSDDHQFLIALHELLEVKLCEKRGITQKQVDDFDMQKPEKVDMVSAEPGDHIEAPYRKEHRQAMIIEHLMANFLGLDSYGHIF